MKFSVLSILVIVLAACSARPQAGEFPLPAPLPDSVAWNDDPELAPLLRRSAFGVAQLNEAQRLDALLGPNDFNRRLSAVAEDVSAPEVVRINALTVLAHRRATLELYAFGQALRAPEERVRMAAVSGMRDFLATSSAATAISILDLALQDPNPRIQARALEILSDRDVYVLRRYHERARNAELRTVARDLIRLAEERGAPLAARDSAGTLTRTTAAGVTITFRPTQSWPQWDAAAGDLSIVRDGAQPVIVASKVEVIDNVVPAFLVGDSALVYEVNREIRVRSLRDGSDRRLATGIAPRVLPFSQDVIFARQIPEQPRPTPTETPVRYQLLRVPASGGAEILLGEIKTSLKQQVKGNASPVRWSRIVEVNGAFFLVGEGMNEVALPSPFGG